MQADLQRLGALIEGWSQADEIPAVERDLALEKLRNLYEAIRFAGSAPEPSAAVPAVESTAAPETAPELPEEEFPESLDLGAVLSLDGFPDLAETEGPIYVEPADPFGVGGLEQGSVEPAEAPAAEEPEAQEPESPAAEEPEPPVAEPVEPEMAPAAEPEPADAESVVETTPASEPTVTPDPLPAPEAAAPKPHHVSPTLFGEEDEEAVRHRHKQRVIMSLYGPSPAPERTPVSSRQAASRPASRVAESAPAEQPFEVIDITEAPESFAGTSDAPTSSQTPQTAGATETHPAAAEPTAVSEPASVAEPAPATEPAPASESVPAADPVETTPVATPDADSDGSDDEAWLSEETISVVDGVEEPAPESRDAVYQSDQPGHAASRTAGSEPSEEAPAESGAAGAAPAEPYTPEETDDAAESPTAASAPMANGGAVPASGAVLGEVINHNVQTLADTIAPPRDIASELLRNEPVTDLRRAIGLNDKFLLIRDLFDGDSEAFARAIDTLNGFDNLDDCMIFIAEHYAWNPNSDGAKLMMDLLERKFA